MNVLHFKRQYESRRHLKPAPVWSKIWGELRNDPQFDFESGIRWTRYVSPSDYAEKLVAQRRPEADILLEQARKRQEEDALRKAAWLETNDLNPEPYIEQWEKSSFEVRDELLDIAVSTFPMMDGLAQVNETLKFAFEMKEAEIDQQQFSSVVESLFRMKVFEWAIKRAFPDDADLRSTIMHRVAARELPTKDNMAEKRGSPNVQAAIQELTHQIQQREVHHQRPKEFDPFQRKKKRDVVK